MKIWFLKGICTINMMRAQKIPFMSLILPLEFIFENFVPLAKWQQSGDFCPLIFPPPCPHISSSSGSHFLLLALICVSGQLLCWEEVIWAKRGGNVSQRRRKSERTKNWHFQGLFAYGEKFSKINPSGNISDIKGIFWAHIMFMVHIPFDF